MPFRAPTFNVPEFQAAIDAERTARGLTWTELAAAVHVNAATIRQMHLRGAIEADAVVLILQWLRRPCADFVEQAGVGSAGAAPIPPLFARVDTIALHAALDRARVARGLGWPEVAAELGVSPGVIARFTKGGRTQIALLVAGAAWAGVPVEALLQPSRSTLGPARMDARAGRLTRDARVKFG